MKSIVYASNKFVHAKFI